MQKAMSSKPLLSALFLCESLAFLSSGMRSLSLPVPHDQYMKAIDALMANTAIDIDFKKIVQEYWKTFLPDAGDPTLLKQTREEILQWFSGEGQRSAYQKKYGINKMINRQDCETDAAIPGGFCSPFWLQRVAHPF